MIIYASDDTPIISVKVDDSSYKYEEIMGDCNVYLEFALTEHVEIEPGSYILFEGVRYELLTRENVTIQHNRNYEYKATFSGPQARFGRYTMYNTIDGRLKYDMIGKPLDHLTMVVANLNMREPSTWAVGDYIDKPEALVSYNKTSVKAALDAIAEAFDTEWSVEVSGGGYVINLKKLEFNKDNPVALKYGKNQGFKPGVGRFNYGEYGQVEKVWIDGGERNLSVGLYGWTSLHFPASLTVSVDKNGKMSYTVDGTTYSESGFDSASALTFVTDEWGSSVKLAAAAANCIEAPLDLTQFYPKRIGTVTGVHYIYKGDYLTYAQISAMQNVNWEEVQVDIDDSTIGTAEGSLDYSKCLFSNDEPLTVIFQDGMLAGREFNATFVKAARTRTEDGQTVTVRPANRFELVRTTIDGVDMPNATFRPNAGSAQDKYIVVNCYMPDEYICDFANFEGAEIDALREACKFIRENKDPQFTFKGQVDDLYSKRNWLAIGGKLILGGCISFQDDKIQPTAVVTRIVGIKTAVNNPYSPEITLSNETVKGGMASLIAQLKGSDEHAIERVKEVRRFSKRSYRDAKETVDMLQGALDYFSEGINPITVETMSLLVGDASLQFKIWTNRSCLTPVTNPVSYDPDTHKVVCPASVIEHMTLGISDVRPSDSRAVSEFLRWSMSSYESPALTGVDQQGNDVSATAFYLYAKVDADNVAKADSEMSQTELTHIYGTYLLSKTKKSFGPVTEDGSRYYYLLVGILNSEYEGSRSFAPMYGFTEILPGQITTDVIRSASGDSYFDLANNQFALGNKLTYANNKLTLKGALVVTGSNEEVAVGAFCGVYDSTRTYAAGDEVVETVNGETSTYRYVYATPSSGHYVTDTQYWMVVAKGATGGSGQNGLNTAIVFLYKRAATATIDWTNTLTYNFTNKALTSTPSGWSQTIPAHNGLPLQVTAATASSRENTDTIEYTEWATPVVMAEDGDDALNTATVRLYKRASSTPSAPSGTLTYTFATGLLSGSGTNPLGGWSQSVPSGTDPCYVIQATAIATGATDTIASSEWSSPVIAFSDGKGVASVTVYYGYTMDGSTPTTWVEDTHGDGSDIPQVGPGAWIWTKTVTTYTDGTTKTVYSKALSGGTSPVSPFRGLYSADAHYYGSLQRTDIIKYVASGDDHSLDGYYRANPLAETYESPNQSSPFHGIAPGNTAYWLPFQGQFDNLATGFAFIEQLVVQRLNTAGEGASTKRIVAEGNELLMYDGVNADPKMRISGEDLSGFPQSTSVAFGNQTPMAHSGSNDYNGNLYAFEGGESYGISIPVGPNETVKPGAVLRLPSIQFNVQGGLTDTYTGDQMGTVYFRFGWMVDGVQVTEDSVTGWFGKNGNVTQGSFYQQVNTDSAVIPLSSGETHTVKLWCDGYMYGCADAVGHSWFLNGYFTGNINIPISYPVQKTEIGANGFQVAFGSDQMLKCIIANGTTTFLMQSDNAGIEVSSSGQGTGTLRIRLGNQWYVASKDGNYLKLTLSN